MPKVASNGIQLHYEESGSGIPVVFVHEFAGDYRSWEHQLRVLSARYRAISYSARGYLPSDVPEDPAAYSQDASVEDLKGLLDALGIDQAHICGLSMGSFTTLYFGMKYPERARSLTIAGSGYGSGGHQETFHKSVMEISGKMLESGIQAVADSYTLSPQRVQLQNKSPRGWEEFRRQFDEHSALGSAYTLRGVQMQRPLVTEKGAEMAKMTLPCLILLGDEDEPGMEGSLFLKRNIPRAGLEIFPRSGHAINLEEPERFNRSLLDFISAVDAGRWEARDPRSLTDV